MKVVYVARFSQTSGSDDEGSILHALRELGHTVEPVREERGRFARRLTQGADLLLFHHWVGPDRDDLIHSFHGVCPRIFWFFDLVDWPSDPSLAVRCRARRNWMAGVLPHVEHGFCTDGDWVAGAAVDQNPIIRENALKLHWLPQGADERITGRGTPLKGKIPPPPVLFTGISKGGGQGREDWVESCKARFGDLFHHVRVGTYRESLREMIARSALVLCPDSPVSSRYWCVDEETEALTTRGWKGYTELSPGDIIYTLNPATESGEWQQATDVFVSPPGNHEMFLIDGKCHSSMTTLNHRWPIISQYTSRRRIRNGGETHQVRRGNTGRPPKSLIMTFRETETLRLTDHIILAAQRHADVVKKYSDEFVELVAWAWTEGGFCTDTGRYSNITQSHRINQLKVDSITRCLTTLYGQPARSKTVSLCRRYTGIPSWSTSRNLDRGMTSFNLNKVIGDRLAAVAPGHIVNFDFVMDLTDYQLQLFVSKSVDADGSRHPDGALRDIFQKRPNAIVPFEMACAMAGIPFSRTEGSFYGIKYGHGVTIKRYSTTTPLRQSGIAKRVIHEGIVWCPTTPNGTWMARRNGKVFFTGNSNRIYNAAGFGGCVIHPYSENLADQYEPGAEVVFYKDRPQMYDQVERLLIDREMRKAIGIAALARTNAVHLYRHRCARLIEVATGVKTRRAIV